MTKQKNRKRSKKYSIVEWISLIESSLQLQRQLEGNTLSSSDRAIVEKKYDNLLKIQRKSRKGIKRPESTEETRYYREPFISYLNYLFSHFIPIDSKALKLVPKFSKSAKKEINTSEKSEEPKPQEDKIIYTLTTKTLNRLDKLESIQFVDKMDVHDKEFRIVMELHSYVLISKYINLRLQSVNREEQVDFRAMEEKIDNYQHVVSVLDEIIRYSLVLNERNLDEKTKNIIIEKKKLQRLVLRKLIQDNLDDDDVIDSEKNIDEFRTSIIKEKEKLLKLIRLHDKR